MVVRTFARHLKTLEPATEIPPDDALPHHYRRITPHLFTPAELDRLLAATGSLGPAFRARTWHTFLGLLAVSGLRTSEACGLDRTDVDLTGGLLTVRDTKVGKSRQVPVHASTVTALRRYARERHMDAMLDHDEHGTVVVGGVHKWVLEGNWKLAAEQFATDWYHVNMSHASALMVLSPSGKKPNAEVVHRSGRQYSDANGNGAGFPVHPKNFDFSVWPINWRLAGRAPPVSEAFRRCGRLLPGTHAHTGDGDSTPKRAGSVLHRTPDPYAGLTPPGGRGGNALGHPVSDSLGVTRRSTAVARRIALSGARSTNAPVFREDAGFAGTALGCRS